MNKATVRTNQMSMASVVSTAVLYIAAVVVTCATWTLDALGHPVSKAFQCTAMILIAGAYLLNKRVPELVVLSGGIAAILIH